MPTIRFVLALLIGAVAVLALWLWGTEGAAGDDMLYRGVGIGVIILALPFVWLWCCATIPAFLHSELTDRVKNLEVAMVPKLAISGRHADNGYRTMDLDQLRRTYYCEIEVQNLSETQQISDVSVTIEELSGDSVLVLPQTLFPKEQKINAGVRRIWKVASGSHVGLGDDVNLRLNIDYGGQGYRVIGGQSYKMKIHASGAETPVASRNFTLAFDEDGRPMLIPDDEGGG